MCAAPAGAAQPGHADALAHVQPAAARTQRIHRSHRLMAGHDRQPGAGQLAFDQVEIGAAHGTTTHFQPRLARPRLGKGPIFEAQRCGLDSVGLMEHHRLHPFISVLCTR